MPSGVYERTDFHRQRISEGLMGHEVSDEARRKMSEAWTPERRATARVHESVHETEGWTPEKRKAQSERLKGRVVSDETRRKISEALTGRKLSMEHRAALCRSFTPERRKRLSELMIGTFGPLSPRWIGDDARPETVRYRDYIARRRALEVHDGRAVEGD